MQKATKENQLKEVMRSQQYWFLCNWRGRRPLEEGEFATRHGRVFFFKLAEEKIVFFKKMQQPFTIFFRKNAKKYTVFGHSSVRDGNFSPKKNSARGVMASGGSHTVAFVLGQLADRDNPGTPLARNRTGLCCLAYVYLCVCLCCSLAGPFLFSLPSGFVSSTSTPLPQPCDKNGRMGK